MQVMTSAEFEQTEVLVGRQGKTESFGVSEDPALMMMLSTGLYSNPHRTMIQEIMFNAWDAHHMAGIQETTPIDIYINDTTGLIVRDYGPGIAKEMMTPIYCIYGASTKREDKGSTGGFGLGSKSPYAYTESFTVSSFHKGKQNMYLMSRVSDENDGKPGKTPIIEDIPTEESGLRVIVPLKSENDMEKTYEYIKDLTFLSGIWANIHYMDNPVETIKADKISAGSWTLEKDQNSVNSSLWAVYGGVRYNIPHRDEYDEEYRFIKRIARHMELSVFIGFAPDSLTPLPSREGLNMSDRTIENIKSSLETLMEFLETAIKPSIRANLEWGLDKLSELGIDPIFMINRWRDLGHNFSLKQLLPLHSYFDSEEKPEGIPENSWESINKLVWMSTKVAAELVGWKTFNTIKAIVWAKKYPKLKYLDYVSHGYVGSDSHQSHYDLFGPKINQEFHEMLNVLKEATSQNLTWRALMSHRDTWTKVDGWRKKRPTKSRGRLWGRDKLIADLIKEGKLKTPALERNDAFFEPDGDKIHTVFFPKTVFIGKTATALNDTPLDISKYFAANVPYDMRNYSYAPYSWTNFQDSCSTKPILGLVIHKKKGQYDLVVKLLKDAGWTVIEANDPEPVQKKTVQKQDSQGIVQVVEVTKTSKPTFPVFNQHKRYFHDASVAEIEKPDFYIWCTKTAIEADSWTDRADRPSSNLRQWIGENLSNVAYLGNKARVVTVERLGAKNVAKEIEDRVKVILADKKRIHKMVLHEFVKADSNIPHELLAIPEMQKFIGLPYLRTKEAEQFETDRIFLSLVQTEKWSEIDYELKDQIKKKTYYQFYDDEFFSGVSKICEKSRVIDRYNMQRTLRGKKPGELKVYSEKLIRFLKTI